MAGCRIDRPVVQVNREMSYGYYADEFQLHTQLFTCNTSIRLCEAAKHMNSEVVLGFFILKLGQIYYNSSYNFFFFSLFFVLFCFDLCTFKKLQDYYTRYSREASPTTLITFIVVASLPLWLTQTTTAGTVVKLLDSNENTRWRKPVPAKLLWFR